MIVDSRHSAPHWLRNVSREFVRSALGTSALALRHGPRAFFRTLDQSRAAAATISQIRGGALASAAIAIGGVTLRSIQNKQTSAKVALREIVHEGIAEALCGGASALVAATAGVVTSKALLAAGITGIKGSVLLVGIPLSSAVVTTVVLRHFYDQGLASRFQSAGPGSECSA